MRVTELALLKISEISDGAFRFTAKGNFLDGYHLDLIPNSARSMNDIIIETSPLVLSDIGTANFLAGSVIDVQDDQFIITKSSNELSF